MIRSKHRSAAFLLVLMLAARVFAGSGALGTELPVYRAQDADADVVTGENLLASDRFWPFRVELIEVWRPDPSGGPLRAGTAGTLIRVEPPGSARVDFGRHGVYAVPVDATDLIQRANRIRIGELKKTAPNFLISIGPRLADSAGDVMQAFDYTHEYERRAFLCVFADPNSGDFAELAAALAPVAMRYDVLPIVFPQGQISDRAVGLRLRSLGWKVPFVFDHLSEPYTRSLLSEEVQQPVVLLQNREGRVLFSGIWDAELAAQLDSALADPL